MLDFHLGTGGIEDQGEHLGGISMEEMEWLQKNNFLIQGKTGHSDDHPESIPYFDDTILSLAQVKNINSKFQTRLEEALKIKGFNHSGVNKLKTILEKAINQKQGLSTIAD
tara:strand:+ start:69 stop:401 length:333 start_codon:yes stop_codon:yes gene_type:complete